MKNVTLVEPQLEHIEWWVLDIFEAKESPVPWCFTAKNLLLFFPIKGAENVDKGDNVVDHSNPPWMFFYVNLSQQVLKTSRKSVDDSLCNF